VENPIREYGGHQQRIEEMTFITPKNKIRPIRMGSPIQSCLKIPMQTRHNPRVIRITLSQPPKFFSYLNMLEIVEYYCGVFKPLIF
jgi:hypothetical protein